MRSGKNLPQTVYATILLAFIFSGLCFFVGAGLVLFNWNNPIWDARVRIIMIAGTLVILGLCVLLGRFIRQKPD